MDEFIVKGIVGNVSFRNEYADIFAVGVLFFCIRADYVAHFVGSALYPAPQLRADAAFSRKPFGNGNNAYPELFRDYEIVKGKMDDVFLTVTGKKLTGGDEK